MTLTLLHISDLHFGQKKGTECFLPEVGDRILQHAERLRPDALVVSGDLTIRALPEEMARAKAWLDRFQVGKRIVIPGNHDARGPEGLEAFRRVVGSTQPCLKLAGAMVVGVDSTEEDREEELKDRHSLDDWEKARRMSKGYVGPEQYPRILADLAQAEPDDLRVIVIHHHLVGIPGVGIDTDPLIDSGDLLDLFLRHGVHLVLAGHKHRPWTWSVNGLRILHSGTSTSNRYKSGVAQNFFNVIRAGDGRLAAERVSVTTGHTLTLWDGPVPVPQASPLTEAPA